MAAPETRVDPAPHLEPHRFKPGQSGNPAGRYKWRTELEKIVGRGTEMFELAYQLATGHVVVVKDVGGRSYKEKVKIRDRSRKSGYRTETRVLKLVPTAAIILQAQTLLMDRAFGRPTQTVEVDPGPNLRAAAMLGDISPEDQAELLAIAHRRLLRGNGAQNGQGSQPTRIPETISGSPGSSDPQGGSAAESDPQASEGRDPDVT